MTMILVESIFYLTTVFSADGPKARKLTIIEINDTTFKSKAKGQTIANVGTRVNHSGRQSAAYIESSSSWYWGGGLGLVRLVRRGAQLDQPIKGLGKADLALRRDRLLPLFHCRVAGQQQWLGVGALLPAQQPALPRSLPGSSPPDPRRGSLPRLRVAAPRLFRLR
jgi:hypothetical protein